MLPLRLQSILFLTSVFGMALIIYLIRKDILLLRYSAIWLLVAIISLVLSIFPGILSSLSQHIGIQTPANALFLFGFYFVLLILFSLTISISKNSKRVKSLNQELALLKNLYETRK